MALAACLSWANAGRAAQVPLDAPLTSLLAPGAFAIVGTEEYSNFTFHASATNGGYVVQSGDITVEPYTPSSSSSTGIAFQTPALFVANGEGQDVMLAFDITELSPSKSITSMELMFDGATGGNGRASIGETVDDSSNNQLGQGLVVARQGLVNGGNNTAMITFLGHNTIHVSKDISLFSGASTGANNTAEISDITQWVDPTTTVPEPSTIVMMAFGAGGLGLVGWRKKMKDGGQRTEEASRRIEA
jgi:hypothetical protein